MEVAHRAAKAAGAMQTMARYDKANKGKVKACKKIIGRTGKAKCQSQPRH